MYKLRNLLIFLVTLKGLTNAKYLTEKPYFLTPCRQNDPSFSNCLAHNLEAIIREWKDGIPGLKSLGSIDPIIIKRIKFTQNTSSTISINADLQNIQGKGLQNATIQDVVYDPQHYVINLVVKVPKMVFDFDYKIKGHVLALNLNSQGKGRFVSENTVTAIQFNMQPRYENGLNFLDVVSFKAAFREIGSFHLHLDNLFNGQKEFEDTANELFNSSWRDLYEVLRPSVSQTVDAILLDRFKKSFAYVPANYFIEDIH